MKIKHIRMTIEELIGNFHNIQFPEFQREPTVWKLEKKQRLIHSILRNFDISSIYFFKNDRDGYDCIDGRQRINAILSYLGINNVDEDDNGFHLKIDNEIYDDGNMYGTVDQKRYSAIKDTKWGKMIKKYELNIVEIDQVKDDEELNLLFLRLQIASVLNAGEKLNAMTGDMRDWIFHEIVKDEYFKIINIPNRRFAKEQVAAQIALNLFSKKLNGVFHRSRYVDLQNFFKEYSKFNPDAQKLTKEIRSNLEIICDRFADKLKYIKNRAISVSIYLFIQNLLDQQKNNEIDLFADFIIEFLKTLKWQISKGFQIDTEYRDLLNFQTNISQAAGEKTAIEKRHYFLDDYFVYYKKYKVIKGDSEYKRNKKKEPSEERKLAKL